MGLGRVESRAKVVWEIFPQPVTLRYGVVTEEWNIKCSLLPCLQNFGRPGDFSSVASSLPSDWESFILLHSFVFIVTLSFVPFVLFIPSSSFFSSYLTIKTTVAVSGWLFLAHYGLACYSSLSPLRPYHHNSIFMAQPPCRPKIHSINHHKAMNVLSQGPS